MNMFLIVDGDVRYIVHRIVLEEMRDILNDEKKRGMVGYPTCWAIVDNNVVIWPKPIEGLTFSIELE